MLIARMAGSTNYELNGTANRMMLNARGRTDLPAAGGLFVLKYQPSAALTTSYGFNICVDMLGRSRSVPVAVTGSGTATCLAY